MWRITVAVAFLFLLQIVDVEAEGYTTVSRLDPALFKSWPTIPPSQYQLWLGKVVPVDPHDGLPQEVKNLSSVGTGGRRVSWGDHCSLAGGKIKVVAVGKEFLVRYLGADPPEWRRGESSCPKGTIFYLNPVTIVEWQKLQDNAKATLAAERLIVARQLEAEQRHLHPPRPRWKPQKEAGLPPVEWWARAFIH